MRGSRFVFAVAAIFAVTITPCFAQVVHTTTLTVTHPADKPTIDIPIPAASETTIMNFRTYPPGSPNFSQLASLTAGYNILPYGPYCGTTATANNTTACPDTWEVMFSFAPIVIWNGQPKNATVTLNIYIDEPYVFQYRATIPARSYYTFSPGTVAAGFVTVPPASTDPGMPLVVSVYSDVAVTVRTDSFGPAGRTPVPSWISDTGQVTTYNGLHQTMYASSCNYASDAEKDTGKNCPRIWGVSALFIPMQWVGSGFPNPLKPPIGF